MWNQTEMKMIPELPIGGFFESILTVKNVNTSDIYSRHSVSFGFNTALNALEFLLLQLHAEHELPSMILLPFYTCPEMWKKMISLSKSLHFSLSGYHINELLLPDNKLSPPDDATTLITNYFGILDNRIRKLSPSGNLILDNCQALYSVPWQQNIPTIYSMRKFIGVPDGAFLAGIAADKKLNWKANYQCLPMDSISKTASHSLLRRAGKIDEGFRRFRDFEKKLAVSPISRISNYTVDLIKNIDFEEESRRRHKNFQLLHKRLHAINELDIPELNKDSVPMVYPLLITRQGERERLQKNGVFTARYWNGLPATDGYLNKFEKNLVDFLLPLPIDGRYGEIEMNYIADFYD